MYSNFSTLVNMLMVCEDFVCVQDGSHEQVKPNKLINWLYLQKTLLGKIVLRLWNICCATKKNSATKISRNVKVYL